MKTEIETMRNIQVKCIATSFILTIQTLGLRDRCSNYNDSWENTKELFLKEAGKGVNNPLFWEAVENIAKTIKEFTK